MRTYTIEGNMVSWTGEVHKENSFGAWSMGEQKCFIAFTEATREHRAYAEWWCEPDEDLYAEIGLRFRSKELTDYDGIFCLPYPLVLLLESHGYDCRQMREDLAGDGWEEVEGEDYVLVDKNPPKPSVRFADSELTTWLEIARVALKRDLGGIADEIDMDEGELSNRYVELVGFLESDGKLQA